MTRDRKEYDEPSLTECCVWYTVVMAVVRSLLVRVTPPDPSKAAVAPAGIAELNTLTRSLAVWNELPLAAPDV